MKIKKIIIYLIALLLFINISNAIGISPSRTIVNFEPNSEQELKYTIYNQEDKETTVRIYAKGDLNSSIEFPKEILTVSPKTTLDFKIKIKFPSQLEPPGIHDNRIGVVESATSKTGETMVGGITGVESQLFVNVPYPGKYATMDMEVGDVIIGEPITFKVLVNNLGTENIASAKAKINVYDTNDSNIITLNTDIVSIKTKESAELQATWNPKELRVGTYKAIATLEYDGKTIQTEKKFKLGDLVIEINKIGTTYKKENKAIQFDIELQSLWNEIIPNVYAEIKILDKEGKEIDKIKTESIDMPGWSKRILNPYWIIKDNKEGYYIAEVYLNYANKTAESSIEFEIKKENEIKNSSLIIIILMGIIAILIFMYIKSVVRKKRELF